MNAKTCKGNRILFMREESAAEKENITLKELIMDDLSWAAVIILAGTIVLYLIQEM